jgi:hypothetical protein
LGLLAGPVLGQIRFDQDKNCTVQGGDLQDEAGRACLRIEASLPAFIELRDGLTKNMPDAGGGDVSMTCTDCSVTKGLTGCAAAGDVVTIARRRAALHRIACILTSHRDQNELNEDVQATIDNFTPGADIGDGDPQ